MTVLRSDLMNSRSMVKLCTASEDTFFLSALSATLIKLYLN